MKKAQKQRLIKLQEELDEAESEVVWLLQHGGSEEDIQDMAKHVLKMRIMVDEAQAV